MEKEVILKHIKATRIWLDKAENWLENNNLIKAILTLFLASAEIQTPLKNLQKESAEIHRREKLRKNYIKYYISTAVAASFLIISTFVYFYFKSTHLDISQKELKTEEKLQVKIPSSVAKEVLQKKEEVKAIVIPKEKNISENLKVAKKAKVVSKFAKISKIPAPSGKEYTLNKKIKEEKDLSSFDIELIEMVKIAEKALREGAE